MKFEVHMINYVKWAADLTLDQYGGYTADDNLVYFRINTL